MKLLKVTIKIQLCYNKKGGKGGKKFYFVWGFLRERKWEMGGFLAMTLTKVQNKVR